MLARRLTQLRDDISNLENFIVTYGDSDGGFFGCLPVEIIEHIMNAGAFGAFIFVNKFIYIIATNVMNRKIAMHPVLSKSLIALPEYNLTIGEFLRYALFGTKYNMCMKMPFTRTNGVYDYMNTTIQIIPECVSINRNSNYITFTNAKYVIYKHDNHIDVVHRQYIGVLINQLARDIFDAPWHNDGDCYIFQQTLDQQNLSIVRKGHKVCGIILRDRYRYSFEEILRNGELPFPDDVDIF